MNKADLILHPARLKILLTLTAGKKTTQEISNDNHDVPKSSIYRHLKLLLDGGMVSVAETRSVKGIEERFYQLSQAPHLTMDDISHFSKEDHLRYFTSYLASLLQDFANYLDFSPQMNMLEDRAGYTEAIINMSTEELDLFQKHLQQVFAEIQDNKSDCNRRRHKFVLITYPIEF